MTETAAIRAFVAGWPIAHSRSPLIHGYWLKKHAIDGIYEAIAVQPDRFDAFMRSLPASGYAGGNVTIPHKEAAFRGADVAEDTAEILQAANTIWLTGQKIHAANTDVYGFLANLDAGATGWDASGGAATVLGAGGAARAIVYGLLVRDFDPVVVVNRTVERAEEIASRLNARFGKGRVRPATWDALPGALPHTALLVNTTALGMTGHQPLKIDLSGLDQNAVVTDIVYAPLETDLLKQASARGHRTVDGLGMLLHQAVPGFETWFGVRPAVDDTLRSLIVADLMETS